MAAVTYSLITQSLLLVILGIGNASGDGKKFPDDCKVSSRELEQGHYTSHGKEMKLYQPWRTRLYPVMRCFLSVDRDRRLISCADACRSDDAYTMNVSCKGRCNAYHTCFVINSTSSDAPLQRFCAERFPDNFSPPPDVPNNVTSSPNLRNGTFHRNGTDVSNRTENNNRSKVLWGGGAVGFFIIVVLIIYAIVRRAYRRKDNSTVSDPEDKTERVPLSRTGRGDDTEEVAETPGDPLAGDPLAGDPPAGDPLAGDSLAGDSLAGDPLAGDPLAGDSLAGDSLAGDSLAGDPSPAGAGAANGGDLNALSDLTGPITDTPGTEVFNKLEPERPSPLSVDNLVATSSHDDL